MLVFLFRAGVLHYTLFNSLKKPIFSQARSQVFLKAVLVLKDSLKKKKNQIGSLCVSLKRTPAADKQEVFFCFSNCQH